MNKFFAIIKKFFWQVTLIPEAINTGWKISGSVWDEHHGLTPHHAPDEFSPSDEEIRQLMIIIARQPELDLFNEPHSGSVSRPH